MVKELEKKVKIKNTNNMLTGKFKPNTGFKMTSPLKNKSKKQQYAEYVKKNPEAIDKPGFREAMDAASEDQLLLKVVRVLLKKV